MMNRFVFTLSLIVLSFVVSAQPKHESFRCGPHQKEKHDCSQPSRSNDANFDSLKKCHNYHSDDPQKSLPLPPPPPELMKAHSDARTKVAQIRAQSDLMHEIIPIVAIIIIFTAAVIIVWLTLRYNMKKRQAQFTLATKALEAGKDIPEGLFQTKKEENKLNDGIFFISFGIGIIPLFWFIISFKFIWIGILFILLGIGQILSYYILKKKNIENV